MPRRNRSPRVHLRPLPELVRPSTASPSAGEVVRDYEPLDHALAVHGVRVQLCHGSRGIPYLRLIGPRRIIEQAERAHGLRRLRP